MATSPSAAGARLLLGPVLRHVGATTATVWVQTSRPAEVEVLGCRASTFTVGEQHYALVTVSGLEPGSATTYQVHLDEQLVAPRVTRWRISPSMSSSTWRAGQTPSSGG
ncbi:MAG: hypothetical protein ACRDRO_25395 [Pseudonocardiaceae bacterium]